jgi:hypothetical protein
MGRPVVSREVIQTRFSELMLAYALA